MGWAAMLAPPQGQPAIQPILLCRWLSSLPELPREEEWTVTSCSQQSPGQTHEPRSPQARPSRAQCPVSSFRLQGWDRGYPAPGQRLTPRWVGWTKTPGPGWEVCTRTAPRDRGLSLLTFSMGRLVSSGYLSTQQLGDVSGRNIFLGK